MKTTILTAVLLAGTSLSAYAEGCNWGHAKDMTAQAETLSDDSQVLTTGQISVAGVDCTATPDAAECVQASAPVTN